MLKVSSLTKGLYQMDWTEQFLITVLVASWATDNLEGSTILDQRIDSICVWLLTVL